VPIVPNFILKLEHKTDHQEELSRNISRFINCTVVSNSVAWNSSSYNVSLLEDDCFSKQLAEQARADKKKEVEEYGDANVKSGLMFGSKALVQMLFNPFVGPITNR